MQAYYDQEEQYDELLIGPRPRNIIMSDFNFEYCLAVANCKTHHFLIISDFEKLCIYMQINFRDTEKWFSIVSSLCIELCWRIFVWEPIFVKRNLIEKQVAQWSLFNLSAPPKTILDFYLAQWIQQKNAREQNSQKIQISQSFWTTAISNVYHLTM